MKNLILSLILGISIVIVGGCQSTGVTPTLTYVSADRQTKSVAEKYMGLTKADHPDLADSIDDFLLGWELRLTNAEKSTGATTQPAK